MIEIKPTAICKHRPMRQRWINIPAHLEAFFGDAHQQLHDRLRLLKHDFCCIALIGEWQLSATTSMLQTMYPNADIYTFSTHMHALQSVSGYTAVTMPEALPLCQHQFDLIIPWWVLHTINDVPGYLRQVAVALKPDGHLLCPLIAGDSLFALRRSMMMVDEQLDGGIRPHLLPMMSPPMIGSLLQRAGLALPVVDVERTTLTLPSAHVMIDVLRHISHTVLPVGHVQAVKHPRHYFATLLQQLSATPASPVDVELEVVWASGFAPSRKQQQSLTRGSATQRLADALTTVEIRLPRD